MGWRKGGEGIKCVLKGAVKLKREREREREREEERETKKNGWPNAKQITQRSNQSSATSTAGSFPND